MAKAKELTKRVEGRILELVGHEESRKGSGKKGVFGTNILALYKARYNEPLDFKGMGYGRLQNLVQNMPRLTMNITENVMEITRNGTVSPSPPPLPASAVQAAEESAKVRLCAHNISWRAAQPTSRYLSLQSTHSHQPSCFASPYRLRRAERIRREPN